MANVAKIAERYISGHPSVKDCLKSGLINYSSLSRMIISETNLNKRKNFDAVLIACRRFKRRVSKEASFEKRILKVLKESKLEVKNKIIAVVLEKDIPFINLFGLEKEIKKMNEVFRVIEGISAVTIITSENFLNSIQKIFRNKIIMENTNLAEITIRSPKEIETTPGTYAYLCSMFAENSINIVETLSCWTDTIFLVNEADVGKIMGLLRF